jgi:magnesium-transporting ATPase (P-type)
VEHAELRVDQSTLTGENTPVRKTNEPVPVSGGNRANTPNLIFAGTNVAAGRGKAIVTATGMRTEFGRIAGLTQSLTAVPSPLQQELGRLTTIVSIMAVSVGAVLGGVALVMGVMDVTDGLVFALGMIVAFVPEGMLPTVTLSLAMGTAISKYSFGGVMKPPTPWMGSTMKAAISPSVVVSISDLRSFAQATPQSGYLSPRSQR